MLFEALADILRVPHVEFPILLRLQDIHIMIIGHFISTGLYSVRWRLRLSHGVNRRMGGSQSRNRHSERRTRDIIHANTVTEFDGLRVAAVLAADPDFQIATGGPSTLDAHFN